MNRVTADSNIYVSALRFGGKPLTLLEMALDGQIELTISDAILNETVGILCDKFHRTPEQLRGDEAYIAACAKHVSPAEIIEAGHPSCLHRHSALSCASSRHRAGHANGPRR